MQIATYGLKQPLDSIVKQQNETVSQSSGRTDSSRSTVAGNDVPKWADSLKEPRFIIELENYRLRKNDSEFFVGRDKEKLKLKNILESNWNSGGAYLVAGYRGVGKTEFVKTALDEYECSVKLKNKWTLDNFTKRDKDKKPKRVLQVNISLGNEKRLGSMQVLNDVVSLMFEGFNNSCRKKLLLCRWLLVFPLLFLGLLLLSALELFPILGNPLSAFMRLFVSLGDPLSELEARNLFQWIYKWSIILTVIWCFGKLWNIYDLNSSLKIHRRLSHLLTNMSHSSEKSHGTNFKGISFLTKYRRQVLNSNEIELEFNNILKAATDSGWHIIFVFDELDKLTNRKGDVFEPGEALDKSERRSRKRQVDNLLGELKSLISTTHATYIFISGRDMYDAYLSELGSPNSLYESLFRDHIYISSLLTDHSDGNLYLLDSMIEHVVVSQILSPKESAECMKKKNLPYLSIGDLRDCKWGTGQENSFFSAKAFVHFLAIHSWGNCKRIITIFDSFVVEGQGKSGYRLEFRTKDIQRLILASHLYILFHHHLARVFINADDKLVVSSFAVFHYIMKFHDMGFSRPHINRMYQTLNVHNSPELAKVVEIIINKVLNNHIRKVRNSYYRYRFSSLYEQEIHYITTISEKESAAFSFSLDAMDSIKRTYKKMLASELSNDNIISKNAVANLYIILGNFHFWEQSFDEANTQYQSAISIYENEEITGNLDVLMALIEAYMKRASVEERMGNYSLSAAIYTKAIEQVERHCNMPGAIHVKDSKMDMLKQPYWALRFLHLKRSAVHYTGGHPVENIQGGVMVRLSSSIPKKKEEQTKDCIDSLLDWVAENSNTVGYPQCCHNQNDSKDSYYNQFANIDVWHYRRAVIKLYMGKPGLSYKCFMNIAKQLDVLNSHDERTCYLGGKTLLRAGYSLLIKHSKETHLRMRDKVLKFQLDRSFESSQDISKYQKRMMELVEMLGEYLPFVHGALDAVTSKTSLEEFRKCIFGYKDGVINFKTIRGEKFGGQGHVFPYAIGLMSLSATAFEKGGLNGNSAAAYLSVISMWTVLLEMLPWRLLTENRATYSTFLNDENQKKFNSIISSLTELRNKFENIIRNNDHNWVKEAEKFAFEQNSYSTSKAMSHSAKVLLRRSSLNKNEGLFSECANVSDMVNKPEFYENYLYQHYSMFGQMTLSSIKWESFSSCRLKGDSDVEASGDGKILPFSVRYYSTMLWLQGRYYLNIIMKDERPSSSLEEGCFLSEDLKQKAIKALVKFYRASQYVVKTAGDSSNAMLPPLFMIYYNMWEVVFYLVESFHKKMIELGKGFTYENAISKVVVELDKVLAESMVKDVSSRILDLSNLSIYTLDHFSIALKMGDPNSREATGTLQSKYYLDDDFEDDIFTLDWCYTQVFAPGAYIHSQIVKVEMARLRAIFEDINSKPKVHANVANTNKEEQD